MIQSDLKINASEIFNAMTKLRRPITHP